jgi:DNA polymerase-3 subunit delta'
MQFKDVIGQQQLKTQLIREASSDRVAHAQLFLSRPGTGGLPLALAFAQYINCDNPGETDSCNVCASCVKAAKLTHPDIHFSFPAFPKKSGKPHLSDDYLVPWREALGRQPYMDQFDWLQFIDAGNRQGNITALECRHIIRQLGLKAFEGKYKVQIIWMVEALGNEGNILLKLLEEPPLDTVLILIAEQQEKILNTILSRTQIKVLDDLSVEEIKTALVAGGEQDDQRAAQLAYFADGNYHRALALQQKSSADLFKWLDTWLSASMNNQANALLDFIGFLNSEGREKVKHFFDYMLHFFRECLTLRFQESGHIRLMAREKELAEKIWLFADLDRISRLVSLVEEKHYHVERNVNPKYILLDLSVKSKKILRGKA